MSMFSTISAGILAIAWEPELRGLLTVIIAVGVLCGSVYLILGTNLGVRLGFLVAFAGLAGWMMLMGIIWMIYGIGMQGPLPSWEAIEGRTVIQDVPSLYTAGVVDEPVRPDADATFTERAAAVRSTLETEGWEALDPADPSYGQAFAAAQTFIEEEEALAAGQFVATNVYITGGERYPKLGDSIDFIAFFHEPRYAVVEVAAIEPTRIEPGRAPATAVIDETRQRQYVYMVRDLGARRQPAAVLTFGGGIIFLATCWLLHRRDAIVRSNVAAPAATPGTAPEATRGTTTGAAATS
jgi:hypothetical protein